MSEEKQMCKNHPDREAFVADVCYECLENSYAASAAYMEALKPDQPAPAEAAANDTLIVCGDDDTTVKQDVQGYVNHRYEQKIKELQAELTAANEARLKAEADSAAMQEALSVISQGNYEACVDYFIKSGWEGQQPSDFLYCAANIAHRALNSSTAGRNLLDKLATAEKALEPFADEYALFLAAQNKIPNLNFQVWSEHRGLIMGSEFDAAYEALAAIRGKESKS